MKWSANSSKMAEARIWPQKCVYLLNSRSQILDNRKYTVLVVRE